ncbi:hypothetical protein PaecuDRAFT_3066 [Paenibacillus curdlanolyticus YK9]|uniref:Uncharacterized protein n=1 Tax=Paenibacillus curdlanolyticus YK9 TaxID=717606 RepID=E0IBM7_9BACL|nr:hypothetical protein [Paenibacillus curdlanolyticus]EFM10107.1 hypothetical protein PaecuDRAFT_3066 [Paenibacillus curdlanolyticus YK9]
MKLFIHIWVIALAVVISVGGFHSVYLLLIGALDGPLEDVQGYFLYVGFVAIITTVFVVPASLLILKSIKRQGAWWCMLRTWLHMAAGAVIIAIIALVLGGNMRVLLSAVTVIYMIFAALQAGTYYGAYLALRRMVDEEPVIVVDEQEI